MPDTNGQDEIIEIMEDLLAAAKEGRIVGYVMAAEILDDDLVGMLHTHHFAPNVWMKEGMAAKLHRVVQDAWPPSGRDD